MGGTASDERGFHRPVPPLVAIESFLASYAYWQLTEVFSDLGETVDPPIQLSPSPVTGSIQIVIRRVRKLLGRKEEKGD